MANALAKQIAARLRAKGISPDHLQGPLLRTVPAVRNIMRGKAMRPSAVSLQAVADVLGCTVKDLLSDQNLFKDDAPTHQPKEPHEIPFDQPTLFAQTVALINEKLEKKKLKISVEQYFSCVEETYLYTLQAAETTPSQAYADWFIGLIASQV